MPLEAADKAMICSAGQASPWFDWCWSPASFSLLGSCFKTLVDLRFLPNDGHEARTWSCGTARLLSLQVYNVDMKPGQITKVLSIPRHYILLIHPCMYPLCCPLPLCIHGNSCLLGSTTGNLQCLKRIHLIMFIVGNIRQFLSFLDQWEWGFKLYCILVVLERGSLSEVYILFWLLLAES